MKHIFLATVATSSLLFTPCVAKDGAAVKDAPVAVENLTAAGTVESWVKNGTSGKISTLWSALPQSYQKDVSSLAHKFGNKVDAEIYNKAMGTLGSTASLLKNKKAMILEILKEQAPKDKAEDIATIEKHYDSVVGLLSALTSSEAKTAEGLKKLDVTKLMGDLQVHTEKLSALGAFAGKEFEAAKNAKVTPVSEDGNNAVVKVAAGDKNKELKLTKKEGRWVPTDMVQGWPEMIGEANKGLEELGEMKPEEKQQFLMILGMVDMSVKGLEQAKTKEELMQKVQGLMGMFMGGR